MKAEVRSLLGENKVDEAEAKMNEVRSLDKAIAMQKELEAGEDRRDASPASEKREKAADELEREYRGVFLKGLRRQRISSEERSIIAEYEKRTMHEGGVTSDTDGDSSLIVPADVSTQINTLMRSLNDLSAYFRVETVGTLSGSRILEKDEDMVALAELAEYGEAQALDNPKFSKISYSLVKRGGILPLTNELLRDSDQNVLAYVTNWIGKKVVVTRNSLITTLLATLTPTALADIKAIKKVVNVTLDPAVAQNGMLLTNQDGYNWMDEQVDGNGRFLLTDDITQPGRKLFLGKPVGIISNKVMASSGTTTKKAPIFLGDPKQFAVLFTRGQYEIASTAVGGDAFKRDTTDLRVIVRDDLEAWDAASLVYGQVTLS
jgi:HK97 family phage major capsid protein